MGRNVGVFRVTAMDGRAGPNARAGAKAAAVVDWREAMIRLADQHFFDLMRMYLGAIKTPFNKQRLVEDLSAFLRKKETVAAIVASLDPFDLLIVSAIRELPSPTRQKTIALLSLSRSFPEIYERILNLEERLVIYRRNEPDSREYAVNPLLADALAPKAGLSVLVRADHAGPVARASLRVDDLALAALYSFFLNEGEAVRNDGTFRKKTLAALESAFPQISQEGDCLRWLLSAFQNLDLLVKVEGRLVPDQARWQAFAKESAVARQAWLVAAARERLPRETLRSRARVFLAFFDALADGARYTPEMVSRLEIIVSERSGRIGIGRANGRFSAMLRDRESAAPSVPGGERASLAQIARAFALILEEDGFFVKNSALGSPHDAPRGGCVVSPSLDVTVMPGLGLAELLPLALCMEVRDVQIAGQFELTRSSCAAAFDQGFTGESIVTLLRSRSVAPIPQNVEFSIRDWFASYSSISLYHGFVLRVDESRRVLFENDEYLSSLIRKILAPGVYLLDADSSEEIQSLFADADLDFLPSLNRPLPKRESASFPSLRDGDPPVMDPVPPLGMSPDASPVGTPDSAGKPGIGGGAVADAGDFPDSGAAFRKALFTALDALSLPPDIDEALRSRIERKIILSPAQLDAESVRPEKLEARGMDFLGKVRIAEYALATGSLLEIVLDDKDGNRRMLARPVSTEKRPGDVLLNVTTEPDGTAETVSLGKAALIRRIRGSIFSELPG